MISFKGRHHKQELILQCVRWYVAYSLSYRDLEELMQERGYAVDHSTIQSWVVHYAPRIEKAFRQNKKQVGNRWRLKAARHFLNKAIGLLDGERDRCLASNRSGLLGRP